MKSIVSIVVVCIAMLFIGCPDERIIDNTNKTWFILATTNEATPKLSLIQQPANVTQTADVFSSVNGVQLSGKITKIVEFDTALYLIIPETMSIEVISRNSYKRAATINTAPHKVRDICFANSTTAYSANDDSTVSIIDVTVNLLLLNRDIAIGADATSIASLDNQICVCSRNANSISIIDSRTNKITATASTPAAPTFVASDPLNRWFDIVCIGSGKSGEGGTPSEAHLVTWDITTKNIGIDVQLNSRVLDPIDIVPKALIVTPSGIAFVPINGEVSIIDPKNSLVIGAAVTGDFELCAYNRTKNQVAFFGTASPATQVAVIDGANSKLLSTFTLSQVITSAVVF